MRNPRVDLDDARHSAPALDSHGSAPKPSPKDALFYDANRGANQAQKALAVLATIPLHQRPVVSYAEVAALGISPERTLRRLVATGRVKRSLIRTGRRVRFVVQDLLDELRQAQG